MEYADIKIIKNISSYDENLSLEIGSMEMIEVQT